MKVTHQLDLVSRLVGIGVTLIFLTACAITPPQRSAITDFGDATNSFAQLASTEFHHMRNAVVSMNVNRLSLEGGESSPDLNDLDEQFDEEVIQVRLEAAGVLQEYGNLLVALSMGTQEGEIQAAADKFVSSIHKLPVSSMGISQQQLGALGELAKGIGARAVEAKQTQTLKRVINQAQDVVNAVCDLFAQDFDPSSGRLASQYLNTTERLIPIAKIEFYDGQTVSHRARALEAYQLALKERERRKAIIQPLAQAATELKAQHEDLNRLVHESDLSTETFKALGKRIRNYKWTVEILKDAARQLDWTIVRRVGL